jgi:hypothetical protein
MTYSYDVKLIRAFLIVPANHFPILVGEQTWLNLGRMRDAFQKNQKEERGNERKQRLAWSVKKVGLSGRKNPS